MSKYAIQGFTQGFLNSESEKIDREQERADKIADEMRKLRLKGLEQQQADWDANDKAYKKIQSLLATGNKSDARQAMAVYATMSGNKDAFDALGEEYDYFNDAAVENLRSRMDGLLEAHGERPSYTVDDLNKNNYRVKRRQTAFESTLKDIFNFGGDSPSWEVTTKRPLPSHGYSSMLRDAEVTEDTGEATPETLPFKEEETPEATPLDQAGDTTGGEVTPLESSAGEDWLQKKAPEAKTIFKTIKNKDGSETIHRIDYTDAGSTSRPIIQSDPGDAKLSFTPDERAAYTAFMQNERNKYENMESGEDKERMGRLFDIVKAEGDEGAGVAQGVLAMRVGEIRKQDQTISPARAMNQAWNEMVKASEYALITDSPLIGRDKGVAWQNEFIVRAPNGQEIWVSWDKISEAVANGGVIVE